MKTCNRCKKTKDFLDFSKKTSSRDKLASLCKVCQQVYSSKYYKSNKDKSDARSSKWRRDNVEKSRAIGRKAYYKDAIRQRARILKKYYGLTLDKFNEMLKAQNDSCAICEVKQSVIGKSLCVDHDHKSGAVRGLLCGPCNNSLGLLKESPSALFNAINYLNKYNSHSSTLKSDVSMRNERILS